MQPWKNRLYLGTWLLFFLHWGYMTEGGSVQKPHYVVSADNLILEPFYENSVNPFLSHMEQSGKLKPIKHKYSKKKMAHSAEAAELPVDPSRPHFVDSKEAEDTIDDNKDFGNGEKDLRDLFSVLFSGDY